MAAYFLFRKYGFGAAGWIGPKLFYNKGSLFQVVGKTKLFSGAILEAFQVFCQQWIIRIRQAVDDPLGLSLAHQYAKLLHVAELLGHFDRLALNNFKKMTNAQRPILKQIKDAQPKFIAEAFVDLNYFHTAEIALYCNFRQVKLKTAHVKELLLNQPINW